MYICTLLSLLQVAEKGLNMHINRCICTVQCPVYYKSYVVVKARRKCCAGNNGTRCAGRDSHTVQDCMVY